MAIPYRMPPVKGTIQYTQRMFNEDMHILCDQIAGRGFDLIIGINRGGCLPAVCLSHHCSIPTTMIDYSTRDGANISPTNIVEHFEKISKIYSSVLIVDDLVDSGLSMKALLAVAAEKFEYVTVATLLHNTDVDIGVPHFSARKFSREDEPRYFDFWWEVF